MADCNPTIVQKGVAIQQTGPRTVIVPADPIQWNASTSYEYLTLVTSEDFGQGYVSKKDVPSGTPLTNTDYWIPVANFNAQLATVQQNISDIQGAINDITTEFSNIDYVKYSGKKITIFSDSTFQPNGTTGIASLIGTLSGASVTNLGVGGYTTSDILNQVNGLGSIDADYVLIAGGVNDFQGNFEILPYNASTNTANLYSNVCGIIERVQSLSPSSQVTWVCHAYYHNNSWDESQTNAYGLTIKEYNDVIEYACGKYNVGCIRLDEIMGINSNNYASQLDPSGETGINVHFNSVNEIRVATLVLMRMCCGTNKTCWSDGKNLIYDMYRYALSALNSENLPANIENGGIAFENGSNITLHFHTPTYGTYYVSGYAYGTIQINTSSNKLFATTASGYFCVPFNVTSSSSNDIVVFATTTDVNVLNLAVTKGRNNPALSPCPSASFDIVVNTGNGNLNLHTDGFTTFLNGNLKGTFTVTPNTNVVALTNWVGIDMVGSIICIKSGVVVEVPARISAEGNVIAVQGATAWTPQSDFTELYLSFSGVKFQN